MLHSRLGRFHFHTDKQVAMITGHGTSVVVFPVLQCPCLRAERQFDPLCAACHGTGRYYPPGLAYATTLLLVHESSQRELSDPGSWIPGTVQASILPGIRLSERDKIQWLDVKDVANDEVLYRGIDDTVRHTAGVALEVVADFQTIYRAGTDYLLSPPHTITWVPGGQAPAFGAQYSVRYAYNPEYLVVNDAPRLRVEHRIPQSQEVILMRLDTIQEGA